MAIIYPLMFICLFVRALAQIAAPGPCPEVASMQDFDMSKVSSHQSKTINLSVIMRIENQVSLEVFRTMVRDGTVLRANLGPRPLCDVRLEDQRKRHCDSSGNRPVFIVTVQ